MDHRDRGLIVCPKCGALIEEEMAGECCAGKVDAAEPDICPDGQHRWVRRRMGGAPDAVESYEVVEYCDECGIERLED